MKRARKNRGARHLLALLAPFLSAASFESAGAAMQFSDVTTAMGIGHLYRFPPGPVANEETRWSVAGAVADDFNRDGWIDLYVLQTSLATNHLYINHGGTNFVDEAGARGADLSGDFAGASAADFDNDGDIDICVTELWGPVRVLRNNGLGMFAVDTNVVNHFMTKAMSPSWGDTDNDGLLELVVGQWDTLPQNLWLLKNTGAKLVPYEFRLSSYADQRIFAPGFADINNDGLTDLLAVGDFQNSQLYLNRGEDIFERITDSAGVGTDENGMGTAVGDIDADGDLDWFVSSISEPSTPEETWSAGGAWSVSGNRLYENNGDGTFADVTATAGVRDGNWGWGSGFGDFDNDGDLDLFQVNGWSESVPFTTPRKFANQPARLFENQGRGSFVEVAASAGVDDTGQGRGVVVFDFDNDGDLDLFLTNNQVLFAFVFPPTREPGPPRLLRNDSSPTNHWLQVTLTGSPPLHRDGIGSRVYVASGGVTQMRELNASTGFLAHGPGRIAHFGLGAHATVTEVRAEWVGGDATLMENVVSDTVLNLPGPSAVLSKRECLVNEMITASAAAVAPAGNPREWVVDDQVLGDPLLVSFPGVGTQVLRLNIYEPDGTTLLRSELYRIRVRFELSGVSLIDSGLNIELCFECESGRVYQVEAWTDGSTWHPAGIPTTAKSTGARKAIVDNAPPGENYRVRLME